MEVDFYTLDRAVQDRFADSTRAIGLPTPIVSEAPRDRRTSFWLVSSAILVVFLVWVVQRGFGNLDSTLALASHAFAGAYAVLIALWAYCVVRALALQAARAAVPYEPGLYLFPAGVFDARSEPLRVFLHPELKDVSVTDGSMLRVTTAQGPFAFRLPDAAAAEQARQAIEQARDQYAQAVRSENRREQAMLDPLVDSGFSSPFSPKLRLARRAPVWATLAPVIALLVGAALGPMLWKARNVASERKLFARATAENDVAGYRAYLDRGGPRAEVRDVYLPRAELREAMQAGSVEALEAFSAEHQGSKIASEVQGALQAAVTAEFLAASKVGTVTALREFGEKRKAYAFIQPAVQAGVIAIYKNLLAHFIPGKDPAVASFFERLLGYSKEHGPNVVIRFVRRTPDSEAAADNQVKLSAYFMGKQSIPSQYFTGDFAAKREATAAADIAATLEKPFPKDVLSVSVAPTFADSGDPPPVASPELRIEYAPEMAGGYMSPKPRGVFVGVGMMFKSSFAIPGDSQPLDVKSSLWRTPNPQILSKDGTTVADVYEHMAAEGFAKFMKDLLTPLVGAPSTQSPAK
jgi:hypothetical protein